MKSHNKLNSEKSFGWVFFVVFAVIASYPLLFGEIIRVWALIVAGVILATTLLKPKLFYYPNRLWNMLGHGLGVIMTPVVLAIIFYCTVVPMGWVTRALGKDLLNLKKEAGNTTYWKVRKDSNKSMKYQF